MLAALNPYRLRTVNPHSDVAVGLQHVPNASSVVDTAVGDMSNLVYKVHPIPDTLKDLIFDFGALDEGTEKVYITKMLEKNTTMSIDNLERDIMSSLIGRSQTFVREYEGDPSVVSLRDVKRCIDLLNWFYKYVRGPSGTKQKISSLCRCTVLALAHVYAYRLPTSQNRYSFWLHVSSFIKGYGRDAERVNFYGLSTHGFPQRILDNMQRRFVNNLVVDPDVSVNKALTENLFVTIVCLLNKIPIFIVGKPGTSKTLCIQIIASNLQGEQSTRPLWRNFPAVHFFQYQCSPLSTAESILYQYNAAKSYQEHSQDVLTALLLDEVGLAENSPDMPLKVLHYMLIDPPIAIIGLSNWVLDSSKMNRAVCLQRPDPSKEDIILTGKSIVGTDTAKDLSSSDTNVPALIRHSSRSTAILSNLEPFLECLARAFHILYSNQPKYFGGINRRDFIGMRDYYSLLKFVKDSDRSADVLDPHCGPFLLVKALSRNFGGQPASLPGVLNVFFQECYGGVLADIDPSPVLQMIEDNLNSSSSRHLMILSSNDIALQLILGYGIIPRSGVNILIGSHFKDDLQELHLIQQINQVKNAMAKGEVIALLNNDGMFESLYDVLNQRYVIKQDIETGQEVKMLRLALGPRSQLCPVKDGFKLVIFVNQQQAYDSLDLPLLNRFEKQVLYSNDFLDDIGTQVLSQLQSWCDDICSDTKLSSLSDIFCGFYSGTLSSLLVMLTDYGRTKIVHECAEGQASELTISALELLNIAKKKLRRISFPTAILKSELLRCEESSQRYVNEKTPLYPAFDECRSSLCSYLSLALFDSCFDSTNPAESRLPSGNKLWLLTTKSPLPHFFTSCDVASVHGFGGNENNPECSSQLSNVKTKVVQLALINSEQKFVDELRSFYDMDANGAEILFLLCDPVYCSDEIISHSRLICVNEWKSHVMRNAVNDYHLTRHVVFIVHLPPGIQHRQRQFIIDFHTPWNYAFIDDLRSSLDIDGISVKDCIEQSCHAIFSQDLYRPHLVTIIHNSFQSALAWRYTPDSLGVELNYVKLMRNILDLEQFCDFIAGCILSCLEQKEYEGVSDSLYFHVVVACEEYDNFGGSFREALLYSMEHMVLQAMAHVIRTLDCDFNLLSLFQFYLPVATEWIIAAKSFCNVNLITRGCNLVPPSQIGAVDKHVLNNGLHGPHCGQFPFSHKLYSLLSEQSVKKRVESLTSEHSSKGYQESVLFLTSFMESILGIEIISICSEFHKLNPAGFVKDFVAFVVNPVPGISYDDHVNFFVKLIEVYNTASGLNMNSVDLLNPASILTFYWMHELLLNYTFAVFASHHEVMCACSKESGQLFSYVMAEIETDSGENAVNSLDYLLPHLITKFFYCTLHEGLSLEMPSQSLLITWKPALHKVTADVRMLIQLWCSSLSLESKSHLVDAVFNTNITPPLKNALFVWWSLCFARCVLGEVSRSADICDHPKILCGLRELLRKDCLHNPFDNGMNVSELVQFCENSLISVAIMLTRYLEDFVRVERDFIAGCLPQYPFFLSGTMLYKTKEILLHLRNLPSIPIVKEVTDSHVGFEHDTVAPSTVDEMKLMMKKDNIEHRLHRSIVLLMHGDSLKAEEYFLRTSNLSQVDISRATSAQTTFMRMFSWELHQDESFHFYMTTLQILSSFAEDMCASSETASEDFLELMKFVFKVEESNGNLTDILSQSPKESVRAYAASRYCIQKVCLKLMEEGIETYSEDVSDDITNEVIKITSHCNMANMYFLKSLRSVGGNEALVNYLRINNPPIPLIPNSRRIRADEKVELLNPFMSLQGPERFIEAVASFGQRSSSFESFEKWYQDNANNMCNYDKIAMVIAVFYSKYDAFDVDINLFKRYLVRLAEGENLKFYNTVLDWISKLPKKALPCTRDIILEEIKVNAVILAIRNHDHFFIKILTDPASLKTTFIPSMPRNDLQDIMALYGNSVGW